MTHNKYKTRYAQSRDWSEIEAWYAELIENGANFQPILNLVKYVKATELKNRICAFTSMHKLVFGIYERIEWNSEALHVEFEVSTRKWFFKYYPKPFEPVEFERTYSEEEGLEKFQNIINYLNW